jgi:uncharacterized protein (DUF1501 family)
MANPIPASFLASDVVSALTSAAAANGGDDYKCLIGIYLFGAADSHNMLIPRTIENAVLRAQYDAARPVPSVGVSSTESPQNILGLNGTSNGGGAKWRLHPKLTNLSLGWYNDSAEASYGEHLAVIRGVGTLDKPMTKAQYLSDVKGRPDQLFAHNIQQDLWQAADTPDKPRVTGWFGRAMNLMDPYYNASQIVPLGSYSTSGTRLQGTAFADKLTSTVPGKALGGPITHGLAGVADAVLRARGAVREYGTPANLMYRAFSSVFNTAAADQVILNDTLLALPTPQNDIITAIPTLSGGVTTNPIKEQVRTAARVIHSRTALGQRRQVIMLSFGGWDHHSNLRTQHDRLLEHLDNAVYALMGVIHALGLINNVTIFTQSEFSRTLQSNSNLGTDHGWAGHQFVTGGAVVPGFYGPEPDYTINGERDTGQGRFIPDISIEQYYATMLKWFGVPQAQLPLVLPNLPAFSPTTLGFLP